jgi:hypothetical protein
MNDTNNIGKILLCEHAYGVRKLICIYMVVINYNNGHPYVNQNWHNNSLCILLITLTIIMDSEDNK